MKITGQTNPAIQPTVTKPTGGIAPSPGVDPQPAAGVGGTRGRGSDTVQISDAGRTLATEERGVSASGSLSPERVAELRKRVLEGAYNSTAVVDQVARRILDRGDV